MKDKPKEYLVRFYCEVEEDFEGNFKEDYEGTYKESEFLEFIRPILDSKIKIIDREE